MAFAPCIITGQRGTFLLSEPRPRTTFNRLDVDSHDDSWHADHRDNPTLTEGQPHPLYPGLILDMVDFDEEVPEIDGAPGSYTASCKWLGDLRGREPTKLIGRGIERSLGPNFDEIPFTYVSWTAEPRAITGIAATDIIHLSGNPYLNGQRVVLIEITGGTGLTGQSQTSLGTIYYVINRTIDGFQLSTTSGGSAVNFTTDITAGYVLDARFALGTPHPDYPALFLAKTSLRDAYTGWKNVSCSYLGKMWEKPWFDIITCNGQQFSSSEPIIVDLTGGWTDARHSTFHLPEVVVTRVLLTANALSTELVPTISTPTGAPSIQSLVIDGDTDLVTWNYPYGWSLMEAANSETINYLVSVRLDRYVWRYIWPVSFR